MSAWLRCALRRMGLSVAAVLLGSVCCRGESAEEPPLLSDVKPKVGSATPAAYYTEDPAPGMRVPRPSAAARDDRPSPSAPRSRGWTPNRPRPTWSVLRQGTTSDEEEDVPRRLPGERQPERPAEKTPDKRVQPEAIAPGRPQPGPAMTIPYGETVRPPRGGYSDDRYMDDGYSEGDEESGEGWYEPRKHVAGSEGEAWREERCPGWIWDNFSFFAGVQGFKAPVDFNIDGNFGFHEGLGWGLPFWDRYGVGAQFGAQLVHSDLSGGSSFDDSRTQAFVTAGLFHRPIQGCGWQGGVVLDYLHDDSLVSMDLSQLRGEISYIGRHCHEVGFWTAQQLSGDSDVRGSNTTVEWESADLYALFYRYRFTERSSARVWGGLTGDGDGLLGGEAAAPLSDCWSLVAAFNYRIPQGGGNNEDDDDDSASVHRETWGLGIHLVWMLGRRDPCAHQNPYRPLMPVADNTTFFLDVRD